MSENKHFIGTKVILDVVNPEEHFIVKRTVRGAFWIKVSEHEYSFSSREMAERFVDMCKNERDIKYSLKSIFPRTMSYEIFER